MLKCVRVALAEGLEHIEFVIHSSELMPGRSPRFRTDESIERLYADLRVLFRAIADRLPRHDAQGIPGCVAGQAQPAQAGALQRQ